MLKKILFIVSSFLIGFLLLLTVINATVVNIVQERIKEAVAANRYDEAKGYFSGIYDKVNSFEVKGENGEHIEIYYGVEKTYHTFKKDEENTESYETLETGIHFAIFHLTEDFKLSYDENAKGGVKLLFEEGELFFPFAETVYLNAKEYSFIPFAIEYYEFANAVAKQETVTVESTIKSIEILDSTGTVKFTINETKISGLTFNNELYNMLSLSLVEYNTVQKDLASGKEISKDVQQAAVDKVNVVLKAITENPNYVSQSKQEQDKIYGTSEFLVPVIIAAVIFLALDILVAWLIFRKKKVTKYIPPHQQNTTTKTPYEPEQFNRDVFNVENYDEVESSEEASDETLQIEEKPNTEE